MLIELSMLISTVFPGIDNADADETPIVRPLNCRTIKGNFFLRKVLKMI